MTKQHDEFYTEFTELKNDTIQGSMKKGDYHQKQIKELEKRVNVLHTNQESSGVLDLKEMLKGPDIEAMKARKVQAKKGKFY